MRPPLISRSRNSAGARSRERGFTMALVAAAMVALVGMAALSIDLGTLYQAKTEAQRAADAAALAAARVISVSGITADPVSGAADGSWADICGGTSSPATLAAVSVAQQNLIAGLAVPPASVTVGYGAGSAGGSATDCSTLTSAFAVNPIVTVNVQRANLPIFFAKVFSLFPGVNYSGTSVSGTATAEVFNPSDSGKGAAVPTPVQPRCVKPWIIPNTAAGGGSRFVHRLSGKIWHEGIYQVDGAPALVGQALILTSDCNSGTAGICSLPPSGNPPVWTSPTVEYIPALVAGTPSAVPSCATINVYQKAIGGCDQNTIYTCGTPSGTAGATQADLTENPISPTGATGDTSTAAQCLINQAVGQDTLAGGATAPTFPFQIQAGPGSPLIKAGVSIGDDITTSNSIVTIPIAEFSPPAGGGALLTSQPPVAIVGFLQAFITSVDVATGNVNIVVLNVSGCGYAATGTPLYGTSPVPIRLITAP